MVSKTERDLSSDGDVDALDDLFTDDSFDTAFDDAIEHADLDLDDGATAATETDTAEIDVIDALDTDVDVANDDHDVANDDDDEHDLAARTDVADTDAADPDTDAASTGATEATGTLDVTHDDMSSEGREGDPYVMPDIVPATPETEAYTTVDDPAQGRDADEGADSDDVSDDILDELRQADIDGPVVAYAPQDDTTTAVRRPRRSADYDPAPVPIPAKVPRVLGRKPRVRKVTRVVRHVDPWSVFKIAIIAHLVLYLIVLTASVLLWNVANATGTVDNVERFFESFGWNSFEFNGGELYHAGWIAGLFVVIGMTGLAVLAATLFNLITDLVGGVRFTVLEEEVLETRTSPMRRFVVRRPEPEVPALLHDSSGAMYREAVVDDTGANQRPTR